MRAFTVRRVDWSSDRGSMPLLLLVTLLGVLLGGLVIPVLIVQNQQTRFDSSRVQALNAAQAGVDAVLGLVRRAVSSQGIGLSSALPCGSVTGRVDAASAAQYTATVTYFAADPVAVPSTQPMICSAGGGPFDAATGRVTPAYAEIRSDGTVGTAGNGVTRGRELVTYYRFHTSNVNIAGGVIALYGTGVCLDAGSPQPMAGTVLQLATCSSTVPPAQQQVFSYRQDLTLQLLSSVGTQYSDGLCIDTAAPLTDGQAAVLQPCAPLKSPPYDQQWSFNDNGHFEGSLTDTAQSGRLAGICLDAASQSVGQAITVAWCAGGTADGAQAWIPAPSVGAGAAAAPQWVNYGEFGRCLDVTGQNVYADHLIDYPCKQNPAPWAVTWNQRFTAVPRADGYSALQTYPGSAYCLTSSGTSGGWTTVSPCQDGDPNQAFTVNSRADLPYSVRYTIVDRNGLCVGLGPPANGEVWSAITNDRCTGALTQKWNADPDLALPTLTNTHEQPIPSS